jgi:hypothetical protein
MLPSLKRIDMPLAAFALVALLQVAERPVPPFPSTRPGDWIGTPVKWEELKGSVVLVEVWTFG